MICFSYFKSMLRLISLVFLMVVLASCVPQESTPSVITTLTSFDDYIELQNKYLQQVETRQNEISIVIKPTKPIYKPDEVIEFQVMVNNLTDHDIVIRRPEAYLNYLAFPTPMSFTLIPADPDTNIELLLPGGSVFISVEIQADEFVVINQQQAYSSVVPLIPRPREPLPRGKYSVVGMYQNYFFGAYVTTELYFTDYNAWMGEVETNSVTFEVVP